MVAIPELPFWVYICLTENRSKRSDRDLGFLRHDLGVHTRSRPHKLDMAALLAVFCEYPCFEAAPDLGAAG
jgi:hypothetical protein